MIDATHDPRLRSWVEHANGHPDFPIQNLPLGVFTPPDAPPGERRAGIAIGDAILDLAAVRGSGLLDGLADRAAAAACEPGGLQGLMALGAGPRAALRAAVSALLDAAGPKRAEARALAPRLLHEAAGCVLHVPAAIGDYTDFYAGIHHARAVGALFRPDNPLLPNYSHLPIGYHGRASSVVASGAAIRRPRGQRKPADQALPTYEPSRNLDYELELGIWIGPGNPLGETVPIAEAAGRIAGYCILNDWSARDVQGWEYQPLGPFLAKSFATTISPWIVTPEALAPFRAAQAPRAAGEAEPLPYLLAAEDQSAGALAIELEVLLQTRAMREAGIAPHRVALSDSRHLHWTPAQLVAHHASGGCNLRPGDLMGTGTISAPGPEGAGSLLETTRGGREPLSLPSGETRRFLEDGDCVTMLARCVREGAVGIGFGPCTGEVAPSS